MSKVAHAYQDDKPGADLPREAPEGQVNDPSYKTGRNEPVPVIDDDAKIEDPMGGLGNADSDKQLQQDEREAIDKNNIMKERTRKAKPTGTYQEPSDADMGLME